MPKRSSRPKRPTDPNLLAAMLVAEAIGAPGEEMAAAAPPEPMKNPAAVALGRLGGKKGGPARAEKLSPRRRKAIARKAATARWAQRRSG